MMYAITEFRCKECDFMRWSRLDRARANRPCKLQDQRNSSNRRRRGGEMLFRQLHETMKIDFVAQAPVGQEWELPQKTVICLSQKIDADKLLHNCLKMNQLKMQMHGWKTWMRARKHQLKFTSTSTTFQN